MTFFVTVTYLMATTIVDLNTVLFRQSIYIYNEMFFVIEED